MVVAIALIRVMPKVSKRLVAIVPVADIMASRSRKARPNTNFSSPREYMKTVQNSAATTTAPVQNSNGSRLVAPQRVRAGCPAPMMVLLRARVTPILKARLCVSGLAAGRPASLAASGPQFTSDEGDRKNHHCDGDSVPRKRLIGSGAHESDQARDRGHSEYRRGKEPPQDRGAHARSNQLARLQQSGARDDWCRHQK